MVKSWRSLILFVSSKKEKKWQQILQLNNWLNPIEEDRNG